MTARANQPHRRHLVEIIKEGKSGEGNIVVQGYMPDQIRTNFGSRYDVSMVSSIAGELGQIVGFKVLPTFLTAQLWQGCDSPSFDIELELEAENNIENDIRTPILNLMSLTIPNEFWDNMGLLMKAPGPKFTWKTVEQFTDNTLKALQNYNSNEGLSDSSKPANSNNDNTKSNYALSGDQLQNSVEEKISIAIGEYLFFPCVVVEDVNPTFKSVINYETGWPQSATVDIKFKPLFLPIMPSWKNIMVKPSTISSSSSESGTSSNGILGNAISSVTSSINSASSTVNSKIKDFF